MFEENDRIESGDLFHAHFGGKTVTNLDAVDGTVLLFHQEVEEADMLVLQLKVVGRSTITWGAFPFPQLDFTLDFGHRPQDGIAILKHKILDDAPSDFLELPEKVLLLFCQVAKVSGFVWGDLRQG